MLRRHMEPLPSDGLSGSPLLTIVALGALTLLPFVFMTTTSFVKSCTRSRGVGPQHYGS